jgi:O-antigen/teichoic acid export membrane protein
MPRISPVLKNFLIYSSGTVILKSISFILMPFILRVLPPAHYGLLSLALSFTNILVIISGLGLRQLFGIEYFHYDSSGRRRMANEIIMLYLTINVPLFLLMLINLSLLNKFLFLGTASTTLMLLCLAYCFLQFFTELYYQVLRYQSKAFKLTVLQISTALATISLNLFFLYHFPWGSSGMLFGYTLGTLITFAFALHAYVKAGCLPILSQLIQALPKIKHVILSKKSFIIRSSRVFLRSKNVSRDEAKKNLDSKLVVSISRYISSLFLRNNSETLETIGETKIFYQFCAKHNLQRGFYYLRLGIPFIPGMLFNWILVAGNRWILARYGTLHDVGIYALADTFGQLYTNLILYPMAGSYLPYLMHQFSQNKNNIPTLEQKNRHIMYLSMLSMSILITVGLVIGKPILYWLLPAKYHQAIDYIWFILMGQVFVMGTYFTSALVQFRKKTTFLAGSLLAPALINLALSMALVGSLGIYGCVFATLIAYIAYFVSMLVYNKKLLQNRLSENNIQKHECAPFYPTEPRQRQKHSRPNA